MKGLEGRLRGSKRVFDVYGVVVQGVDRIG